MNNVLIQFKSLTRGQRVQFFDSLIDTCEPQELLYLQHKLTVALNRDFIIGLPPELAQRILSYLDLDSLSNAAQGPIL